MIVRGALGWAGAYLLAGFLGGFLLAVPRVREGDGADNRPKADSGAGAASDAEYRQSVNTNLEQISDWLTKIIVGLGLVELRRIPAHLGRAAEFMAQSIRLKADPLPAGAASFACAFIVFFGILGFLAGYLLTRLFLAGAFWRADTGNRPKLVSQASLQPGDPNAIAIRAWIATDPVHPKTLRSWLRQKSVRASLTSFLNVADYSAMRKLARAGLQI